MVPRGGLAPAAKQPNNINNLRPSSICDLYHPNVPLSTASQRDRERAMAKHTPVSAKPSFLEEELLGPMVGID